MAVVKDWALEAAEEITKGNSIYLTAEDSRAIILKHVPFKDGVAYMPVPRCDQCKHYRQNPGPPMPGPSFGECVLNTSIHMTHLQDYSNAMAWGAHFYVEPGFGCVRWEAK